MYFKNIEIENIGPIDHLKINFPLNESGAPKPLIIVGENGAGKTILLSHLVNALVAAKQVGFDDSEVEMGKVYKYRSPQYIKSGTRYSFSRIEFNNGQYVEELQLDSVKSKFQTQQNITPVRQSWTEMRDNQSSHFTSSFASNEENVKELFTNQCCLYFPVNRFEEPAWLNLDNLNERASYTELKPLSRYSNRNLLSPSPLKANRNWLLDLLFDRQAFELKTEDAEVTIGSSTEKQTISVFKGFDGKSSSIYNAVLYLLRLTLRVEGNLRLGIGKRGHRAISIIKDEKPWIPNIFQLSTGEALLINLFLTTIRDYDLSGGSLEKFDDIKGIVIIDEIDSHLHTHHQKEVLPDLIASFPNVQFIITTHSPLFVLGMDQHLGPNGIEILNMPTGTAVAASDFSEFTAAYEAFKQTNLHRQEIAEAMKLSSRPILFVEGDYDIRYLNKAAELLGKTDILNSIQVRDGTGFGNLDKIWRSYEAPLAEVLPSKIMLLYDCDTNKTPSEKGRLLKRIIPSIKSSEISIGIENLLPSELIEKLQISHPKFIDITPETTVIKRGVSLTIPIQKSINKDEKGNLCAWVCTNGTIEDFKNFSAVFNVIEELILPA